MNTPDFGAMHIRTALILVAFSIVLAVSIFFGWLHAPWWTALIPVGYAWARPSLYRLLCDANYHAMHRFEEDMLDLDEEHQARVHQEVVTLDAESFLRGIRADDEAAGRA